MKILSMTATFGKLSHQTLTLQPGLNIIDAPNEWGKSTWCAFIVAMLYGIDTRQQTTKTTIADKERFAPWSGEPMSGRMELCWQGRNITIERSTKGRIPFGEFRAYETETGLTVPELTAANCGQMLLGVERSVFTRSGFIRLQDMPVTQDESLRRRLNSLVTTGDESGAGEELSKQLRELKNKCRYNRTGLLPQAEYEREQLRSQLQQREDLQSQASAIKSRQAYLEEQIKLLENHADALRYQASRQGAQQIQAAKEACERISAELAELETTCGTLPTSEEAAKAIQKGQELLAQKRDLDSKFQLFPSAPTAPEIPVQFSGITPDEALTSAKEDYNRCKALEVKKKNAAKLPLFFAIAAALIIIALIVVNHPTLYLAGGIGVLAGGMIAIIAAVSQSAKCRAALEQLSQKYPGIAADDWVTSAQRYQQAQDKYRLALEQYELITDGKEKEQTKLQQAIDSYSQGTPLTEAIRNWEIITQQHALLAAKKREYQNTLEHTHALQSVATTAPEPAFADTLTLSAPDTDNQLQAYRFELRQNQMKLGQCIGQADTLGQEDVLKARLDGVNRRILRLEEHYRALELAQEVLYQATTSLQRRFAPRISKRAQEYFSILTDGRYQRISLSDDLSISASAENEDTLRGAGWRSDGTVDQLYLSLRLAVAGEITPEAPLVLDDALIRFDDVRLKAALDVLQTEAETKQVILFTCQGREKEMLN